MSEITCEDVLREIERYVDGELGSDQTQQLTEHLAQCASCLDHEAFQRKLKQLIRSKCGLETPENLWQRIREATRVAPGSETP